MQSKNNNKKKEKTLIKTAVILFWLAVWQLVSLAVNSSLLLPSPLQTIAVLFKLAAQTTFWQSILMTILRIIAGFSLGVLFGAAFGTLTAFSRFADRLFAPIKGVIKATPVASITILLLLWLKKGIMPVWVSFLMVLPIIWANVYEGIKSADNELIEMSKVFMLSERDKAAYIYLPRLMPQLKAALATSLGFAFKSGIATEVIAAPALSIGRKIYESKLYLEIPEFFAWTVSVIILSMITEKIMLYIIARIEV